MNTEIDSLSIADLESRYAVNRSNLYKRINALKEKGYSMEFESRDRKSYANAVQIAVLDRLHNHIQMGNVMNSFPTIWDEEAEPNDVMSYSLTRQSELSRNTRDTNGSGSAISKQPTQTIALTPDQLIEIMSAIAPPVAAPPVDPFENLEHLKRACECGWYLSSSQLKALLNRASLPSKEFQAFGYTFSPAGKNGAEKAWKITKRWEVLE